MYEKLASFAQTWGLLLFILAFVLVLIYALAPGNKKKFDEAKRIPLEDDEPEEEDR
ncbi:MAG: CcoQ/FixQ family Cbb3-type cytochrome c oxidase assembly chaperone [Parvularcula sp.]|uniref:cbb3-type cytochrome c oxidase subunit 3 n=1 Tax=Hyphococcus sp. TaxID=2038636 RepID=UPI000C550C15|nr:CcoQ/FixQ family Cbb3-type cytochrome c oxidase assembly chaperone [Parvularcula sp.]